MIIVQINQPGFVIRIPGMMEMRTPVKFELKRLTIENVMNILLAKGIKDFTITSTSKEPRITKLEVEEDVERVQATPKLDLTELSNDIANKVIKHLGSMNIYTKTDAIGKVYEEDEIETMDEFIPTIDNDMSSKGDLSITSSNTSIDNISDISRSLRDLIYKK
jgi:hypothetical protein